MPTNEDVALETINTIAEKLSKEEDRELLKSMVTVVLNKYESAIAALRECHKETLIAWNVCASIHREFGKGHDALYTTRQADFLKHKADARAALDAVQETDRE